MKIDLIYFYRPYSSNFYLYGPQKVDNNIVVNPDGVLVFSSASAVFNKIDEMCGSLSPEITNINVKSSSEFIDGFKMRIYTGDLIASSEVPDYTDILTNINTNLTNLNSKFTSNDFNITQFLERLFYSFNTNEPNSSISNIRNGSLFSSLIFCLSGISRNQLVTASSLINNSFLRSILRNLQQSVSPNSSITDVISTLNSNIHNDLTDINTTTNNKDTVLIVDGQQDFVIRKQNNDDYDS